MTKIPVEILKISQLAKIPKSRTFIYLQGNYNRYKKLDDIMKSRSPTYDMGENLKFIEIVS
jgi:predicted transcriptional regulator